MKKAMQDKIVKWMFKMIHDVVSGFPLVTKIELYRRIRYEADERVDELEDLLPQKRNLFRTKNHKPRVITREELSAE